MTAFTHPAYPRKDYGPVPLEIKVRSALHYTWWGWIALGVLTLVLPLLALSVSAAQDRYALLGFWALLVVLLVACSVVLTYSRGAFYTLQTLNVRVVFLPEAWDAYIPPEVYSSKLYAWLAHWEIHSDLPYQDCLDAVEGHRAYIHGEPVDVTRSSAYKESGVATAIAATELRSKTIRCWKEQSQNWHGTWEWEWGHLLAKRTWGWTTEQESIPRRRNAGLINSRQGATSCRF